MLISSCIQNNRSKAFFGWLDGALSAAAFREIALSYFVCWQDKIYFTLGKFRSGGAFESIPLFFSLSESLGGVPK